jgi:hypothetical protein
MYKTYVIKNLQTTDTTLRDGEELLSVYVSNTSTADQAFNLKVDEVYVYEGIVIPPSVTLVLDNPIIFDTNRITVSAGAADKLDITYTVK